MNRFRKIEKENKLSHKVDKGQRLVLSKKKVEKLTHKVDKGIKQVFTGGEISESILKDEIFYELCFNNSNHLCEECGKMLPDTFRDGEGRIIARYRYSHIIPKSIAPELRHSLSNINHLCLKHHQLWDFGTKEEKSSMKIFKKNLEKYPSFLSRYQ